MATQTKPYPTHKYMTNFHLIFVCIYEKSFPTKLVTRSISALKIMYPATKLNV